ncbi:FAD-binding oxidoreductase [Lichenihabitans sp. Uapishka_5]|uniref:FAD-binding oxidoreductase n=1 Tax=Lichenihabitans sp. Uapishka_5 TaxID=3037302 RepID=UPI0029E829AE|nr:FAD-binding oxidoreductase [Lichenihabitans sp. Uapishka_5]MDX7952829.1 FAD-binding oxidoreductase [Lichenihabitans sp. Uapishka_5]
MILSGWGRFPRVECPLLEVRHEAEIAAAIAGSRSIIARGNGRAYGDAAMNPAATLSMRRLSRLIAFDEATGLLACEAGTLLVDLVRLFVPRGWFVPVTPGTKFVTVGGMIAADVHGKNHHVAGAFGDHVLWLDLMGADGAVRRCSREVEPDLFWATCGGMGLTGVVLRAAFHLVRIETDLIRQVTHKAANLDEAMTVFESNGDIPYSVAWIDCLSQGERLGRSLITLGAHATANAVREAGRRPFDGAAPKRALRVPFDAPGFALNRWSVKAFNALYYRRGTPGTALVPIESYFYPLDGLLDWNRIYGANGFVQYQFALPKAAGREGLRNILTRIAKHGSGSFLAVLKLFGAGRGFLSFPVEGYTLALDFPATVANFNLLTTLDAMVAEAGGRIYLAKDARSASATVLGGYPERARFSALRDRVDPGRRFASLQSQRLGL